MAAQDISLPPKTVVTPPTRLGSLDLPELWRFRELFFFLVWRDIKVRYKQTVFGALWAIVQPLTLLIIFTIVFGNLANVASQGVPYPLFAFSALIPWMLFSQGLGQAANSLLVNVALVSKIYFPRLIVPVASASSFMVDTAVMLGVAAGMMVYYGVAPEVSILALPLFILLALTTSIAFSLWFSALNVRYRDVRYVVPLLIQGLLYASPIAYSADEIHGTIKILYSLNPMAGVVEGFRWSLLGTDIDLGFILPLSLLGMAVILLSGLFYFLKAEQTFADVA